MKYGNITGLDKPVARLAQGTVQLSGANLEAGFALLDGIFAQGGTTFDTAQVYGGGDSERTLGRWLQERGVRDQVVIITKGAHHNADRSRVTPYDISSDLYDSLARLKTEYVDIYLLHRDDETQPVGPIVEALNQHFQAGRIRVFGGSNWSHARLQAANDYAAEHHLEPFRMSSSNLALADRIQEPWAGCLSIGGAAGAAERDWYVRTQMPLLTWSSLAGGFFSGRFRRDNLDTITRDFERTTAYIYAHEPNFQRLDRAEALAREKGVTAAQIALAYLLHQPLNIYALVGCETAAEFADNAHALEVDLSQADVAWLETGAPERATAAVEAEVGTH
jgi:aryl-alcohol dehydrogenase-like predicted oxidoreductase